jgi:cation:H+ antiporter
VASAAVVIFCGVKLAVYGDALASLTGWGRLFVGSLLVALATSLPELSTNISAVRLDPPNPQLAVGNVFGANMLNMFTLAMVALAFGGKRFIQQVAPEQGYLIVVAGVMTGAAVIFGAFKMDVQLWQVGLSSWVLLILFVLGMRLVYATRPADEEQDEEEMPGMTLRKAWFMFSLVSAGVVIAGVFLAWSTDEIAEITGVASSTLGILAVSFVTTMPEASSTIAAARIGAADLGIAGLYGSCAFNVTILFYADIFYRDGILNNQVEPAHFAAGGVAIGLILTGMLLILARERIKKVVVAAVLALMASAYIAGAAAVIALGTSEDDNDDEAAISQQALSQRPHR